MKKLLLLLAVLSTGMAAAQEGEALPSNLYGIWSNLDGDVLKIDYDNHFERVDADKELVSEGTVFVCDKGLLHVDRNDVEDDYDLTYFVGYTTLVVSKPHEKNHAWLFRKVGSL